MTLTLLIIFELARLVFRLLVLVLCGHILRGAAGALRDRRPQRSEDGAPLPIITVQVPIRNEFYVVERGVRAVCALDYPRDRLEIQVLDDSDDETLELLARLVEELREEGTQINLIHRDEPTGFKGGALNEGLKTARGEFIAIFDADCFPSPYLLNDLMGEFTDPKVGVVQARWSFMNRRANLLTRIQALLFDGLFAVNQHVRCLRRLPSQFNGTNGIWRRACLDDLGGWQGDIITEDLHASFRAVLLGWRVVHRRDVCVLTELPEEITSFRSQQKRWCAGSIQTTRALWSEIRASSLSRREKLTMVMHLGRHSLHPFVLVTCIFSPFTAFFGMPYLFDYGVVFNTSLMLFLFSSLTVYFGVALWKSHGKPSDILIVPLVVPFAAGMSIAYSQSILQGFFSRSLVFVRTLKRGARLEMPPPRATISRPRYVDQADPTAFLELAMAALHAYATLQSLHFHLFSLATFFAMVTAGFTYVGLGSLAPMIKNMREEIPLKPTNHPDDPA